MTDKLTLAAGLPAVLLLGALLSCAGPLPDVLETPYIPPPSMKLPEPAEAPGTAPKDESGPINVSVQEAILLSLEHNQEFRVERLTPEIVRTGEASERAAFDPVVSGQGSYLQERVERLARTGSGTESFKESAPTGSISVTETLPTGTTIEADATTAIQDSSLYSDNFAASRAGVSVTQALLRGFGIGVNLVRLRQARIDTVISQYELRGFAELLVSDVEHSYWELALARRQVEIYEESLRLAEEQLHETEQRIRIGQLAEAERPAAEAEVALRREGLINARSDFAARRLTFLRLLNPPGAGLWAREVVLKNKPTPPTGTLEDVERHVDLALKLRPDMNQARLGVQRGDLEVVRTKNGLLPRLDLFVTFGKTGYATTFAQSVRNIPGPDYDFLAGLRLEYPPLNRAAEAAHRRARFQLRQAMEAVRNLEQLVQVDVRTAYVEVQRTQEQVAATAASRKLLEEKLRVETEKFRVGKSTSLLVAQAQRDLLVGQITEIQSVVRHREALVDLYRLEGSLLLRRGVSAPGREGVVLPDEP